MDSRNKVISRYDWRLFVQSAHSYSPAAVAAAAKQQHCQPINVALARAASQQQACKRPTGPSYIPSCSNRADQTSCQVCRIDTHATTTTMVRSPLHTTACCFCMQSPTIATDTKPWQPPQSTPAAAGAAQASSSSGQAACSSSSRGADREL